MLSKFAGSVKESLYLRRPQIQANSVVRTFSRKYEERFENVFNGTNPDGVQPTG